MQTMTVTDLYEAAYLTMAEYELVEVKCVPVSSALVCRFTFRGKDLGECIEMLRTRNAVANIFYFRNAYSQVTTLMHEAKKSYDRDRKAQKKQAGGEA
jgi:hypothetical protein